MMHTPVTTENVGNLLYETRYRWSDIECAVNDARRLVWEGESSEHVRTEL